MKQNTPENTETKSQNGNDIHTGMTLTFEEAFFGAEKELELADICQKCHGTGKRLMFGTCQNCQGSGCVSGSRKLLLTVPAGTENGDVFRVREKGRPGKRKGTRGDLLVKAQVLSKKALYQMSFEKEKYALEFEGTAIVQKKPGEGLDGYTYRLNRNLYTDVQSLRESELDGFSEHVLVMEDAYHRKVLYSYENIPVFDFGDREWDSLHGEYLMFDGKNLNLVTCRQGYRIAALSIYRNLLAADARIKPYLEKLGYPAGKINDEIKYF